jgi:hypothetical protein
MLDGTGPNVGIDLSTNLTTDLDKSLSYEEYKSLMMKNFAAIVQTRFAGHPGKQKIHKHTDRITGACPYCGDSMQSDHKHRGNIILSGKYAGYYKCFNCGMFKGVDRFLKDYDIDLQLDLVNYLSSTKGDLSKTSYGSYDISVLMDSDTIEGYAVDREELKKRFNLVEIAGSPRHSWLKYRLQYVEERFLYNPQHDYVVILNLYGKDKILGFQRRNFEKRLEKYNTYNLTKIYKEMGIEKEIPESIEILSQLYRITEIDFNQPITLFEGPLDAFLLPNSVANAGAAKSFPLDIPLRYWYDEDKKGKEKALEKLEEGHKVFLWSKFRNEFGIPWRKKWDLNDILIWFRENNRRVPLFEPYFSDDPLDMMDL